MRFLLVNTDYAPFLQRLYAQNPGLVARPYAEQNSARMATLFATNDFYSRNLHSLGHEAWDVIENAWPMQRRWAAENGVRFAAGWELRLRRGFLPWPYRDQVAALRAILAAQIKAYRPDVLYIMCMETIDSAFLRSVRPYYRLAVGQHAATPLKTDIREYDLVLSSLPNQVDYFHQQGLKSEQVLLCFEPAVLDHLEKRGKVYDIVFAGALGGIHGERTRTLEALAERHDVAVWGYHIEKVAPESPLRACYRGELWGRDMYQTLRDARIVFNGHSDLVDRFYANNMRLYEATGVGSLLLTDAKPNLPRIFEPGTEVAAYAGAEECLDMAGHYLEQEAEREAIARAGQAATLSRHSYRERVREMTAIVEKYL